MIIGVDVGYTYTKFVTKDKEGMFRSTVQDEIIEINKSSIEIEYQGKQYTIGEKGAYSVDLNKIDDLTFKLCLYASIIQCMRYNVEEVNLVTGLPIGYYSKQKLILKKAFEYQDIFIKYKGENKVFTINQCLVFPQSAGLIVTAPEKFKDDILIIDIGGLTVDVSYFEDMKLVKYATYPLGMLKLYEKVSQELLKYEIDLGILDVERKLKRNFFIDDKGIGIDFSNILKNHAEEIMRPIKLSFPFKTAKKIYSGGGSVLLKNFLSEIVGITEENIYDNARAFYKIGCEKFDY